MSELKKLSGEALFAQRTRAAEAYITATDELDLMGVMEHLCTPRQFEVTCLLADGMTQRAIAHKLQITQGAVWAIKNSIGDHFKRVKRMIALEEKRRDLMVAPKLLARSPR